MYIQDILQMLKRMLDIHVSNLEGKIFGNLLVIHW